MRISTGLNQLRSPMRSFSMSNYEVHEVDTTGSGRMQAEKPQDGHYWETGILKDGKFYILNGQHLDKYAQMNSFDECMAYFKANSHIKSSWSD